MALDIARDRSAHTVARLEALRSAEISDPVASEKAVRELITDDSDCPLFKLGVIQERLSLSIVDERGLTAGADKGAIALFGTRSGT